MAAHAYSTPGNGPLPLTLIDLEQHPDGDLLRLCAKMTNLQDRVDRPGAALDTQLSKDYWATADRIVQTHPRTADGFQMKALVALAMLAPKAREVGCMTGGQLSLWSGAVAIVNDVIRGMPA